MFKINQNVEITLKNSRVFGKTGRITDLYPDLKTYEVEVLELNESETDFDIFLYAFAEHDIKEINDFI